MYLCFDIEKISFYLENINSNILKENFINSQKKRVDEINRLLDNIKMLNRDDRRNLINRLDVNTTNYNETLNILIKTIYEMSLQ